MKNIHSESNENSLKELSELKSQNEILENEINSLKEEYEKLSNEMIEKNTQIMELENNKSSTNNSEEINKLNEKIKSMKSIEEYNELESKLKIITDKYTSVGVRTKELIEKFKASELKCVEYEKQINQMKQINNNNVYFI